VTAILDISWKLLGATFGAALAILLARSIAATHSGSAGSGIGPIEAALIALVIATARDIAVVLLDLTRRKREIARGAALLADVSTKLLRSRELELAVPYESLLRSVSSDELRDRLPRHDCASFEHRIADIRKYAPRYCEILPSDAELLRGDISLLLRRIAPGHA
jgi:hypothetical protein